MVRGNDFSGVGLEEARRRAHSLVPKLRELAAASETARQLTPDILGLLHETGLLRFLQRSEERRVGKECA